VRYASHRNPYWPDVALAVGLLTSGIGTTDVLAQSRLAG
jgi:hypothetical protein